MSTVLDIWVMGVFILAGFLVITGWSLIIWVNVRKIQAKTNADSIQTENHIVGDSEDSLFSLDRMQVIQTDAGIHILNV